LSVYIRVAGSKDVAGIQSQTQRCGSFGVCQIKLIEIYEGNGVSPPSDWISPIFRSITEPPSSSCRYEFAVLSGEILVVVIRINFCEIADKGFNIGLIDADSAFFVVKFKNGFLVFLSLNQSYVDHSLNLAQIHVSVLPLLRINEKHPG
jgi:hypothetical protein